MRILNRTLLLFAISLICLNLVNAVVINSSQYSYCSANNTLTKITILNNDSGVNELRSFNTICQYGCNNVTMGCSYSPLSSIWIVFVIVVLIGIVFYYITKRGD